MQTRKIVYLDNAATSYFKPPRVMEAMVHFAEHIGANPGRSGHPLAKEAARVVQSTRDNLARLFNVSDSSRIVFALNVTEALNAVFHGHLNKGDHVIATDMEHNSVLRPLVHLQEAGFIDLDIAPCDRKGFLDIDALTRLLRPRTRLVALNHASNVCGTLQDVAAVRDAIADVPLLLDTAQTAGHFPIDAKALGIDFLAFTGHKGLLGPQGTGGLYVREGIELRPFKRGGTGSQSDELHQPEFMPDRMEAGTQNNVGIAGLGAAVGYILEQGVENIRRHEEMLTAAFLKGIWDTYSVAVYGPLDASRQVATISLTFDSTLLEESGQSLRCGSINLAWLEDDVSVEQADGRLSDEYDILIRAGLHCAPLAHKALGTFPEGTVRVSMGCFNTLEDVEVAVRAVKRIAAAR